VSNLRWIGNAAYVTDLWTISAPSGTIVSQTYNVTINGKSVSYTAGGSDTASFILQSLQGLLAAFNPAPPAEFQELTWALVGTAGSYTAITATQNTPGVPSTISVTTSGAATFSITNTTPANGPNFFTTAANWDLGTAPANSSVCYFDNGSIPCLYGLSTSLTGVTIVVNQGYSGLIGLPALNQTNTSTTGTYSEYRTQSLTLAGGTVTINSTSVQRCNIAFGAHLATVQIVATSTQRLLSSVPIVLITGGNSSSVLTAVQGDIGVAFYENQTAQFATISTGYATNPNSDVVLYVGVGATLATVVKNGGSHEIHANVTTITSDFSGGTLTLKDAITVTTLNAYAGTVTVATSGTIGTINLYGTATLTFNADPRTHVFSSTAKIIDSAKTLGTLSTVCTGIQSFSFDFGGINTLIVT